MPDFIKPKGTLLLTGHEGAALITIEECMVAVEHAFKLYGEGKTQTPGIIGVHSQGGGFHIKAGVMHLDRSNSKIATICGCGNQ